MIRWRHLNVCCEKKMREIEDSGSIVDDLEVVRELEAIHDHVHDHLVADLHCHLAKVDQEVHHLKEEHLDRHYRTNHVVEHQNEDHAVEAFQLVGG